MRVGVVGAGAIATKAHIPALSSLEGVEVAGLADADLSKANALAKKYKIAKTYKDYKDLLREEIDIVIICAPSSLHARIAVDALVEGKHVLVEKPLAMTVSEADQIRDQAKNTKLKVGVVFNYRYYPAVSMALAKIREGRVGHVTSIVGVSHTRPPMMGWAPSAWFYSEGGVIDDFGPHLFDLTTLIANSDPLRVTAVGRDMAGSMGCVNQAQVFTEFKNGISAMSDVSWMVGTRRVNSTIYGTGGDMFLDVICNFTRETHGEVTPMDDLRYLLGRSSSITKLARSGRLFFGALYYHRTLIQEFIASIERNQPPSPGLDDGVRVVQICQAARISAAEGRCVSIDDL